MEGLRVYGTLNIYCGGDSILVGIVIPYDVYRYELPQPSAALKNDVQAWKSSVDNSSAQLEHQSGRLATHSCVTVM